MMKKVFLPTLLMVPIFLSACGLIYSEIRSGSGNVVTMEEAFGDFTALDISNSFDVLVEQSEDFSVIIRVDDNFVSDLDVRVQGQTLIIGLKPSLTDRIEEATLEAEVTMPVLTAIDLSNSSSAQITGFSSNAPFQADLSNSSDLQGDLQAGNTTLQVSNSSAITLSGSGADLSVNVSGSGDVDLAEFPVGDATIEASNSSDVAVNVSGTLNVDATNSSTIRYLGSPTMGTIETSNASTVKAE